VTVLQQFSLTGKNALVIGASNCLGRAAAVALAEAGANVAVTTTTRSQAEQVLANSCANEIWALDRAGFANSIDADDEGDIRATMERTLHEFGRLDILVNAPDLPLAQPAVEISVGEWRRTLDGNLTAAFLASREFARTILGKPHLSARIINVASILGERGLANGAAYCAAQAGVFNLTRALALEWARSGITVNAIGAGWTEGMAIIGDDKETRIRLERYLPHKRLARPEEIAGVAVYLASDAAAYLTGQVVWIEGGALSHV
jgi:NAD(P)-dependent dehydrogenase (short-subunit alcohol dehydrogenase family)